MGFSTSVALGYKMVAFHGFLCAFVVEGGGEVKSSRPPSVLEAICSMLPLACGVCLRGAGHAWRVCSQCVPWMRGDLAEFEVATLLVTHLQLSVVGGPGAYSSERPWCLGRQDRRGVGNHRPEGSAQVNAFRRREA